MSCEHCVELELELAALRVERDQLLASRNGTREWLGELLNPSPIGDPVFSPVVSYRKLANELIRQYPDKKIQAIKEMRTRTQYMEAGESCMALGLKDAKDYIDAAYAERDRGRPDGI